ncbi:Lrp/AsnC family transcriptional regulator [Devosia nitrariae]|uniref:AsnC family transcriptional regulator n=1 Tax=Devosia nitrariae TaxID=2071872 RepID=A0ABQ5W9L7_9HYPH|nr:Lrp/AsnC family transcriptional regulator [Devosia nitrariae]GLQ56474.1 AsnC family transcriptional regulator [Devosia nitrariae]
MALDSYDRAILKALQRDGRITKAGLAERVNLTPSPVWERLKRLEASGVIAGYAARLSLKKLAPVTTVMVEVVLKQHRAADFERFESRIRATPEVIDCQATGGGIDYVMKVVVRDIDAYQRLMDDLLESGLQIERYYSYVVTKSVKDNAELPLDALLGGDTA